jgi:hypothetical protein
MFLLGSIIIAVSKVESLPLQKNKANDISLDAINQTFIRNLQVEQIFENTKQEKVDNLTKIFEFCEEISQYQANLLDSCEAKRANDTKELKNCESLVEQKTNNEIVMRRKHDDLLAGNKKKMLADGVKIANLQNENRTKDEQYSRLAIVCVIIFSFCAFVIICLISYIIILKKK